MVTLLRKVTASAALGVLCSFAIATLPGCGSSTVTSHESAEAAESEVWIAIPLSKAATAVIARAEVVITASDMPQITEDLSVSGSTLTGVVTGIPAGLGRLFTLNAYDAAGARVYTGSALADIIAGEQVRVDVTLRSVSGPVGGPSLAVRGTPLVAQGTNFSSLGWSASCCGNDARITGEIENTGAVAARNVKVTVTFRDPSGNLLGRQRDQPIGTIEPGSSELFVVILTKVFSDSFLDFSSYQVEVAITHD